MLNTVKPRRFAYILARRSPPCTRLIHSTAEHADILIVGGGPAGLALATALGSSKRVAENCRVVLVEAGDLSRVKAWSQPEGTYSNRVSSITNASRSFLQKIGGWAEVDESRTAPVEEMQVWDGISDARIVFSAAEIFPGQAKPELSRLTENLNLQRGLLRKLSSSPNVTLLDKVKVQYISPDDSENGNNWPLVHLSDGRVIRTRLLVGADGFNSPVRAYAGIESFGWAYDTHAVVATLNHAPRGPFEPPNTTAYQRFLPTGPIAFLPLSETSSSLVWSTKPHLASALKAVDPSVLAGMINAAFRLPEVSVRYLHDRLLEAQGSGEPFSIEQLREEIAFRERSHSIDVRSAYHVSSSLTSNTASGGIPPDDADQLPPVVQSIQAGTIAFFPLRFSHASSYIGGTDPNTRSRTVLIGDAAHTIHPLAGQGLNLGLGDAQSLAAAISTAVSSGQDVGSYTALLPYSRERYLENHKMLSAVDKLHKLYGNTADPVVWARSVGLEVVNELDSVKAALMISAGSTDETGVNRVGLGIVAAKGVESVARSLDGVRQVAEGLGGVIGAGVNQLLKSATGGMRRPPQ
ncbi:ubiquinone biosynthesis hydrox [Panus rudis PR-1116 ss-1]|nr:ubiquinone biosynthesis hydrox [Panus rudis PR-1116 ss-1]